MKSRGISEIVSYVLLVSIAVAISALVYAFLRLYIPKAQPECPDGISLAVTNAECTSGVLSLNVQNTGRYKVSAAYVRLGDIGREFKNWINDPNSPNVKYNDFYLYDAVKKEPGLFPGNDGSLGPFAVSSIVAPNNKYNLEIQPAVFTGKKTIEELALCPPIEQIVDCTP